MSWRQDPEPPIVIEHTTVNPVIEHTTVAPVVERRTVIEREVDSSSAPLAVAIVLGILVLVGLIGWWAVSANVTGTPPAIVSHTSNTKIIHEGGRAQTIIPPSINRTTIINPPASSNTSSNNGNGSTGSGDSNNNSSDDSPRSNTDSNSGSNSDNNDNTSPSNSNQSGTTTGGQ